MVLKRNTYYKQLTLLLLMFLMHTGLDFKVHAQDFSELENKLSRIQHELKIPGVSLAVVRGNEVVFNYNNGVLDIDSNEVVTNSTIFPIASITKTFTAMAIGILVDQEKIALDDKMTTHLPWFSLNDDYVTQHITIRDVLAHRSGLESEGLIYMGSDFTRQQTVEKLSEMPISGGFRSSFTYSNVLYNALGLIIEEKSGMSWEAFVQTNIVDALGMDQTVTDNAVKMNGKIASSHRFIDYEYGKMRKKTASTFPKSNGPAGSIRSTTNDMAKYLQLLLSNGEIGDHTIIGSNTLTSLWEPHTRIPGKFYKRMTNNSSFSSYGLGWFLGEYSGRRAMFHAGGGGGSTSLISLIPSEDLAVVVFTNLDTWSVFAFVNTIQDYFLGTKENNDWLKGIKYYEEDPKALSEWYSGFKDSRVKNTESSLILDKYVGVYQHDIYGKVKIKMVNGQLVLIRGSYVADLSHWHFDTFKTIFRDYTMGLDTTTFYLGNNGEVEELGMWDVKGFYKVVKENAEHGH